MILGSSLGQRSAKSWVNTGWLHQRIIIKRLFLDELIDGYLIKSGRSDRGVRLAGKTGIDFSLIVCQRIHSLLQLTQAKAIYQTP